MNIVITGASGFIGKHLLKRLEITSPDLYIFSREQSMEGLIRFNPDVIYHLAGEIYKEDEMFESNISLTYRLLEASRKMTNLKAFVAIGSSSEYGRKDKPMSEEDFLDPTTMYEATKGAASLLCQTFAREYGVPVMVARPFSLYGKFEPMLRFIPTIIRSLLKKDTINISPGVHDFIHIDDFIDGLFLLAENPQPGEIYNFGSQVQTSNHDLVTLIEKIMGKAAKHWEIPSLHSYDTTCWLAETSKAQDLGWKPKYTLETGLIQVIESLSEDYYSYGR